MFDNLAKVDWKSLDAGEIPSIIQELFSQDKTTRNKAFHLFDERVVYNGNMQYWQEINLGHYISKILVSELQLKTIPFLIEILSYPENRNKELYNFLIAFASYAEMNDEGELYKRRAIQIKEEIWKSKDIYLNDLSNDNPSTRCAVFSLLCHYVDESNGLSEILLETLRTEDSLVVKSFMLRRFEESFVIVGKLHQTEIDIFQELKHENQQPKTKN